MNRCVTFKSPGPPWYAAQCKLERGHDGPCDVGTKEEAEAEWKESCAKRDAEVDRKLAERRV